MKLKLVALSVLFAAASVQALVVRIPSLDILKSRLAYEFERKSADDEKLLALIEKLEFLKKFAGQEVDSAFVVRQMKCLCLAHRVGRQAVYHSFLSTPAASWKSAKIEEDKAVEAFFDKVKDGYEISERRIAQLYAESSFSLGTPVLLCQLSKLYRVFFKDYEEEVLEELLMELYRAGVAEEEKENK